MAMRRTITFAEYDKSITEAEKQRIAAKAARQRTSLVKKANAILTKELASSQREIRRLLALVDTQKSQIAELQRIADQMKRENERLRLGRDGCQKLGGNLKNIESRVWDGMWARKVSGGSAGTISR